jgi:hypothetical protein
LNVVDFSVDEISLVVENTPAHVSIVAVVANLVSLNADVDVSIDTVNLTILGEINSSNHCSFDFSFHV